MPLLLIGAGIFVEGFTTIKKMEFFVIDRLDLSLIVSHSFMDYFSIFLAM